MKLSISLFLRFYTKHIHIEYGSVEKRFFLEYGAGDIRS